MFRMDVLGRVVFAVLDMQRGGVVGRVLQWRSTIELARNALQVHPHALLFAT